MKPQTLFFFILLAIGAPSIDAQDSAVVHSSIPEPGDDIQNFRFLFDVARFGPVGEGWQPSYSRRLGVGINISEHFTLSGYFDYYKFDLMQNKGLGRWESDQVHRHDIALYVGLRYRGFVELQLGAYHHRSDKVWGISYLGYRSLWWQSGISGIEPFVGLGLQYDVTITRRLFIPVGLYFRKTHGIEPFPPFIRFGLGLRP